MKSNLKYLSIRSSLRKQGSICLSVLASLVLIGCQKVETITEAPHSVEPLHYIQVKLPVETKYSEIEFGDVDLSEVSIESEISPSELAGVFEENGFTMFDMVGGHELYGECAGWAEVNTYFKKDDTDITITHIVEATFQSVMIDRACQRRLYDVSYSIIEKDINNAKNQ